MKPAHAEQEGGRVSKPTGTNLVLTLIVSSVAVWLLGAYVVGSFLWLDNWVARAFHILLTNLFLAGSYLTNIPEYLEGKLRGNEWPT